MDERDKTLKALGTISVNGNESFTRRFRVVSKTDEPKDEEVESNVGEPQASVPTPNVSDDRPLTPEEEDGDDSFFAKSFALNSERKDADRFDSAFAGGLRTLFESEEDAVEESGEDEGESDSARLQRELDEERRESLDGVLKQNDSDFLAEAGEKYDAARSDEGKQANQIPLGKDANAPGADSLGNNLDEALAPHAKIRPESILEAMLFVGDRDNKPLSLKTACELMRNVSEEEAIESLADLNERYFRDGSPYKVVRDGDGFRLVLRREYAEFVSRCGAKTREFKLSQTAIDVLALIAYRQPVTLEEILEVRNNAGSVLTQLVKRDLISQEKQTIDKKKIVSFKTTDRFLKLFNLESLDDLPIVGDIDYR